MALLIVYRRPFDAGYISVNFGYWEDSYGVAQQADGKIIFSAASTNIGNDFRYLAIGRLKSDGTLDSTGFGTNGKVLTLYGGSVSVGPWNIYQQSDLKIVVSGYSDTKFLLSRYDASGNLDTEFNGTGKNLIDFGADSYGYAVAFQSDGKIVISGSKDNGTNYDFALARVKTNGIIDSTFGTNGKVTTDFGGGDYAYTVKIQEDGKIVVGGFTGSQTAAIARYISSTEEALPVELISFESVAQNGKVMLNWSTATESNNAGWEIESRSQKSEVSSPKSGSSVTLSGVEGWTKVAFVAGKGTTTESQSYQFQVESSKFNAPRMEFRLKQIDLDGKFTYSNILSVDLTPNSFALSQNYPNPFNPITVISYQLQVQSDVRLVVFDLLGREVATLVNEKKEAGNYTATFNGANLTSGVYFYKLTAGNFSEIKKMTLIK